MAEYRNADGTTRSTGDTVYVEERRSNNGVIIGVIVVALIAIVALLFLTGFWSADVKGGALPKVNVSAKGGDLPDVDVKSKKVVVGTTKTTVDVPTVKTEKKSVDVPTIGVSDGKK